MNGQDNPEPRSRGRNNGLGGPFEEVDVEEDAEDGKEAEGEAMEEEGATGAAPAEPEALGPASPSRSALTCQMVSLWMPASPSLHLTLKGTCWELCDCQ